VLKVRGAGVASMLKGGDSGPVTFDVDSAVKDLRTMLAEGNARGLALPLVAQTLACYEETSATSRRRGGLGGLGLLGEPRPRVIRNRATHNRTPIVQNLGANMSVTLLKLRPSSTSRSRRAATQLRPAHGRRARCRRHLGRVQARGQIRAVALRHRLRQGLGRARHGLRLAHASRPRGKDARSSSPCWRPHERRLHGHQPRRRADQGRFRRRHRRGRISGDTSDKDEACAIAGIDAAGLKADPGQDG